MLLLSSNVSAVFPSFTSSANLISSLSILAPWSWIKMLNSTGPRTETSGTLVKTSRHSDIDPFRISLCMWLLSQLPTHVICLWEGHMELYQKPYESTNARGPLHSLLSQNSWLYQRRKCSWFGIIHNTFMVAACDQSFLLQILSNWFI